MLLDLNARGQTVLLVTHNPETAARAGRVLHLRDGRRFGEAAGLFNQSTPLEDYSQVLINGGTLK